MHSNATKNMIRLSIALDHVLADIVKKSTEVGVVVPSILKKNLEEAGFQIEESKLKVLYQVRVYFPWTKEEVEEYEKQPVLETQEETQEPDKRHLIAMGASNSPADALVQAIYGFLREIAPIQKVPVVA